MSRPDAKERLEKRHTILSATIIMSHEIDQGKGVRTGPGGLTGFAGRLRSALHLADLVVASEAALKRFSPERQDQIAILKREADDFLARARDDDTGELLDERAFEFACTCLQFFRPEFFRE